MKNIQWRQTWHFHSFSIKASLKAYEKLSQINSHESDFHFFLAPSLSLSFLLFTFHSVNKTRIFFVILSESLIVVSFSLRYFGVNLKKLFWHFQFRRVQFTITLKFCFSFSWLFCKTKLYIPSILCFCLVKSKQWTNVFLGNERATEGDWVRELNKTDENEKDNDIWIQHKRIRIAYSHNAETVGKDSNDSEKDDKEKGREEKRKHSATFNFDKR